MNLLDLFVTVSAKDEASAEISNISNNVLGNLGKAAMTAGKALAGMWAVKKVYDFGKAAFDAYSEFEQLAGGAEKIFDEIDQSKILNDANGAWKTLNMSANEYLAAINQTGAMFAQTMGDEAGYETAKKGMQAISDYATGTGRDINELNDKFGAITRSTSSYQSIADQFAGILPATSADFLEQAQAAGLLSDSYEKLTDVPVAEYQQAVSGMLEKGVADLGLAGNTAKEALSTISGSVLATKSAWKNLVTEFGKPDADIGARIADMFTAVMGENGEGGLLRNVTSEARTIATNMIGAVSDGIAAGVSYIRDNGHKMLGDAMKNIGSTIGSAAKSLGDFTGGFNLVDAMFGENGVGDYAGKLVEWIHGIGQTITDNWPYIQEQLGALWTQTVETALTYGPQVLEVAGRLVRMAGDAIVQHGPELLAKAGQLIGSLLAHLATFVISMRQKGRDFMMGLITGSSEEGKNLRKWFSEFFPDGLLKGLGDFATFLLDAGKSLIQGLIDGITEVAPDVGGALQTAFDSVLNFFGGVAKFIEDPVGNIEEFLSSMGDAFAGTADNAEASMGKVEGSVDRSLTNSGRKVDQYNGKKLNDKKAKATVEGNAVDGSAKKSVGETDTAIKNLKGKDVTVDVKQKGLTAALIDNIRGSIEKLKSKEVTVTTTKVTKKGKDSGGAWGGIRYHATGGVKIADRFGPGVPLDVVGERGPEAIVPLTSRYGGDFARMMGAEAGKYIAGHYGGGNTYQLIYNGEQSAVDLFEDLTFMMTVTGAMG